MEKFPLLRLSGSNNEIGLAHGEMLREHIDRTWNFYRELISFVPETTVTEMAEFYRKIIFGYDRLLADEIAAIARGANMEEWKLFALNSRTELIRRLISVPTGNECSLFFSKRSAILAENWDWAAPLENLAVVLDINPIGTPRFITLTEPGIVGKIGLNECGLGVGLNILRCKGSLDGVPIHILLRTALQSRSIQQAKEKILKGPIGTTSNIVIGNDSGEFIDIEIGGNEFAFFAGKENFLAHTNHYLALDFDQNRSDDDYHSSVTRYNRLVEILSDKEMIDVDLAMQILFDQSHNNHSIRCPYHNDSVIGSIGTVCSIVMNLVRREMLLVPGSEQPNESAIRKYGLT